MAKTERYTVGKVVEMLNASRGMVYLAAKQLGCCPQTVYNYAERHAKVRDAITTQHGERLDAAETALLSAVEKGEAWAVCFTLKTLGKKRGFIERPAYGSTEDAPKAATIIEQITAMDATIMPPGQMPNINSNGHHTTNGNGKPVTANGNGKA